MSVRRYVGKFQTTGNVNTETMGRPSGCVSFHPQEEYVIMEWDKRICRSYGYSQRGKRAVVKRRRLAWGPRITAIPVISIEGLLDIGIYDGNVTGETFLEFVNTTLAPCLLPFDGFNPRSIVILDNAGIHHTQQVINAINATGAMIIYLPPYSPDLMPCEELFAQTKWYIRENDIAWQSCDEPELMVFDSFVQITDEDIKHYIEHAEYF
ncbi:uncharacterized protein LOC114545146 [Dendronephthya gigantea]|uniref:uncharacterized protein LOC114545146 n=1 Tax=Dendronephthya gigantea TaxID=151771 RepID=UPI00106CC276|nr:uncharacterized protein LOC114545146 [Dendronephthya gigantea]